MSDADYEESQQEPWAVKMRGENARLAAALRPFAELIVPPDTPPDEIQHFGLPAQYFFDAKRALDK